MSMFTRSYNAISRIIPTSTGMTFAPTKLPPCIEHERQCPLLGRDRARGRRFGVGRRTGTVRRRTYSRAQPRCEISRHARGGLSGMPVVAHGDARFIEFGIRRCDEFQEHL